MDESTLVVEENAKNLKHITDIMGFMGFESILTSSAEACADMFTSKSKINLVLLGNCGAAKEQQNTFRAIRLADAHVPIILHGSNGWIASFNGDTLDLQCSHYFNSAVAVVTGALDQSGGVYFGAKGQAEKRVRIFKVRESDC